jgi:ribonuclease E
MKKEMLINVLQPEECRIAILEDGILEELYVERTSHESYVGNIYKGRIVNIEPSIQAAFVDFGVGRNGFLHVSDVEPAYYRHLEERRGDRGDRGRNGNRRNGGGRDRDRDRSRSRQPGRYFEEDLASPPSPPAEESDELSFGAPAEAPVAEPTETVLETSELPATDTSGPARLAGPTPASEVDDASRATPEELTEIAEPVERPTEPAEDTEAGAASRAAPEPEQPAADSPPLVALPETFIGEESGKGRRRSRGGTGRRRRTAADKTAAEEPTPEPKSEEEPPAPKLMDSAERRTAERADGPGSAPEISSTSGGSGDDDLLFFPPPPPAPKHTPEPAEPEPEPEEWHPPEPVAETFVPPPRARPHGPRGSIEDELEADLAALEISEDAPPYEESPPTAEAPPPESEPSFEEESGTEEPPPFEDDYAGYDLDADFGDDAPPPPPRDERRGHRDGGRGRDRGDRRGDRRGGRRGGGRPGFGRPKPLIQDIFRRGQEVIVKVIKEGIGTKGPTLSTYISIPGRYLVLMPGLGRTGVSRKIMDEEQRRRLRDIFNELKPPRGVGFIVRTAATEKNKKELQRDLVYLLKLWQVVVRRLKKSRAPAEIFQESDMITRTIRDTFTPDIDSIVVDEPTAFENAQEFMQHVMPPRYANRIQLYQDKEPLFHKYNIEDDIHRIQQRKVPLPYGGSIVIEQTEALVAIDVNSGNFRADRNDAEETAFQINLQAAKEIARQLRLRDLAGVIVNDFIDMRDEKNRRAVEKALRDALKRDRARTKILKTSAFGLIEMTRQRVRPSLKRSVYQDCPYCHGMAQVKTCESMSIEVMRMLQLAAHRDRVHHVSVRVTAEVADYLLNKKRREITHLEESGNILVQINGTPGAPPELLEFTCFDNNNNEVKLLPDEPVSRSRR